ncbi:MAG: hypothetical protein KME64_12330 [Scytonematopsis contorta HA4267-MV1]|jgi:hypothetical protein|nr:hypothetical protein [Scytonematopsis contorta HA4267-MV1]
MKQSTVNAFLKAYSHLDITVGDLYAAYELAVAQGDDADASLLAIRADRLFEEAESILLIVMEHES